MKTLLSTALLCIITLLAVGKVPTGNTPLSRYSDEWNDPQYAVCNTAENAKYLSAKEKEIIYVLNLARMNPKLFCKTIVLKANTVSSFIDTSSEVYYKSLVKLMSGMEPLGILQPDQQCWVSAQCHASTSGKKGYVGHDRQSAECRKKKHYRGECCQYGISEPVAIILELLVDQGVPSLGHREICLGSYKLMSPSFQPHKQYSSVAVLDFYY